ncbi:unnamed protein product, partial [Mesorhabditis belari]|uniref:ribonuclease H n=1 Tax=Mesorhabditis belari TaxID=2138241 RepID=A0AAF3E992_9BILA
MPEKSSTMNKEYNKNNDPRIANDKMMIATKELVAIAEELKKKKKVSIEEVGRLIEEANQLKETLAEVARGLSSVQQGKENKKMISECSNALKRVDHWCKKKLLDEEVKEWVDMKKNSKKAKQVHWLQFKGKLPVFVQKLEKEIISKIENYDKAIIYVWTDGSCKGGKKNGASGFGIYLGADHELTRWGPICHPPNGHSSQDAELCAIETALEAIYLWEGYVGQKVVIFTDNLEVVKAFKQYKERGTAGDVCSLDFNQMKSMKSDKRNKYFPIYKLVQLFGVENLEFKHVNSNRIPTKPQDPGNKEADELAGRTTAWVKLATHQITDAAVEIPGLDSEGFDAVLGSEEEEPTLMDCDTDVDMDMD